MLFQTCITRRAYGFHNLKNKAVRLFCDDFVLTAADDCEQLILVITDFIFTLLKA